MNLFSIDQLFDQMFPWLSGISWDLGTILTALVFLWFLLLAFDWVKEMLDGHLQSSRYNKAANFYYEEAKRARSMRDMLNEGTIDWDEQNLLYKSYLRKSASTRVTGRSYGGHSGSGIFAKAGRSDKSV